MTIKEQKRSLRKDLEDSVIIAEIRHDDECGNGHNSFAITAEIYEPHRQPGEPTVTHKSGRKMWLNGCGCCHDEVRQHFPELAGLIRWHLMGTDQPMHYVANAVYWAGHTEYRRSEFRKDSKPTDPPNIEHLKSTIVYGALHTDKDFDLNDVLYIDDRGVLGNEAAAKRLKDWLIARLPALMQAFQNDVEAFGFTF